MLIAFAPLGARGEAYQFPLVDIRTVDPTIVVDLRYASANNITHRPIYPAGTQALTRPEVAQRLAIAQRFLRRSDCKLKIWDAYRPREAQIALWNASPKNDYVANPAAGAGSLHSWGLAIDATLADRFGANMSMPTDFDDFTPAAFWKYIGPNEIVRHHLFLLQVAMREAGFYGIRSEWWHFTAPDWQQLMPPELAKRALDAFNAAEQQQRKL